MTDDIHVKVNLKEIIKLKKDSKPDFLQIAYRYRFPDQYYICLSDPYPENPT